MLRSPSPFGTASLLPVPPADQEPRCKQTGYGSRFTPDPKESDCKLDVSPQSGGEYDPYSIKGVFYTLLHVAIAFLQGVMEEPK
ncbi:hypothetical protein H6F86_17345 [Phormidium sp. FACHB-592]|uniref:Uncharacterized protein n=1 Tax=Stenomitos frigidus AS-A4 TaxID=2933935 RepID=A0ABV0KPN4_9CYAN|nr:hypothetical protein [Phormidium sp. FACHB-592]MBD2075628.1 hypothetical protein [Phormidium sp. FACHB-592]